MNDLNTSSGCRLLDVDDDVDAFEVALLSLPEPEEKIEVMLSQTAISSHYRYCMSLSSALLDS
jgi:hypothetical protein